MQVFVRFNVSDQYCQTPVMQERRNKRAYSFGWIGEPYPTSYSKRTLGAAVAWALSHGSVAQVEVKPTPNYDEGHDRH